MKFQSQIKIAAPAQTKNNTKNTKLCLCWHRLITHFEFEIRLILNTNRKDRVEENIKITKHRIYQDCETPAAYMRNVHVKIHGQSAYV